MDKFSLMIKRKGQKTFELHSEPEALFIPRIGEKVELKLGSTGYFFEIIDVIYPLSIGANIARSMLLNLIRQ